MSVVKPLFDSLGFNDVIDLNDWNGSEFRKTYTVTESGLYSIFANYLKSAGTALIVQFNGTSGAAIVRPAANVEGMTREVFLESGDIVYIRITGVAMASTDNGQYSITKIQ